MTIDLLGENTILVTLSQEDLQRYHLDFSGSDDDGNRKGLTGLMYRVGEECNLDHRDKSYLIEALPGKENCLLIISVRAAKSRRKYRIKRGGSVECCCFLSADDLLDWLNRPDSAEMSYALYQKDSRYYLLTDYPWTPRQRHILSEYGKAMRKSPVFAARLREYAPPIAIHTVRRQFRYASSAAR